MEGVNRAKLRLYAEEATASAKRIADLVAAGNALAELLIAHADVNTKEKGCPCPTCTTLAAWRKLTTEGRDG